MRNLLYKAGMLLVGLSKHGKDVVQQLGEKGVSQIKTSKMNAFIEGVEIEEEGLYLEQKDIDRYCEQYMYRKLACLQCTPQDGCPHCTCDFPIKMQTPKAACEVGEWGEMMEEDEWQSYKEENKIVFTLTEEHGTSI